MSAALFTAGRVPNTQHQVIVEVAYLRRDLGTAGTRVMATATMLATLAQRFSAINDHGGKRWTRTQTSPPADVFDSMVDTLERLFAAFTCSNTNRVFEMGHKNLSVADLVCFGGCDDGVDRGVGLVV